MKKSRLYLFLVLFAAAPILSACSSSCECPRCPGTTVVTPNGHSTVIAPED